MNKLVIPASLVAIVMVAGMFAFAPVEQASTIHTISGSGLIVETDTVTLADGSGTSSSTVTLTFSDDALLYGLRIQVPTDDSTDDYDINTITANGLTLVEQNAFSDPGANTDIDIDWVLDVLDTPVAITSGNTFTFVIDEDDTTDGADQTVTIIASYTANSATTIGAGLALVV